MMTFLRHSGALFLACLCVQVNIENSGESKSAVAKVKRRIIVSFTFRLLRVLLQETVEKSMPDGSQRDAANGSAIVKSPVEKNSFTVNQYSDARLQPLYLMNH